MPVLKDIVINPIEGEPEVISVEEAKAQLIVDFDADDNLILGYIRSATQALQQFTGRVFVKSECKAIWSAWSSRWECAYNFYNLCFSDNMVLNEGSKYTLNDAGEVVTSDSTIVLEYTAGYEADKIPQIVKDAVAMYVADLYSNRGEERQDRTVGREAKQHIASFIKAGAFF